MGRKKKVDLSAFDGVLSDLGYSNTMSQPETTDVTNLLDNDDIEDLDKQDTTSNVQVNAEDDSAQGAHDDDSEIPEDILNNNNTSDPDDANVDDQNNNTDVDDNSDEPNENETTQIGLFFDAFA